MSKPNHNALFTRVGDSDAWKVGTGSGTMRLVNVHSSSRCAGTTCIIHNPSDHHMRTWELHWRSDSNTWERICPAHGVGHPDPDDLVWHRSQNNMYMDVHGCCGCCIDEEN